MLNKSLINIPNAITLCRLLLLPFFLWDVLSNRFNYALIIFAAIALSDKLDGVSARLMSQVTEFGKAFDSAVDGIVVISTFIAFNLTGKLDLIWLILAVFPTILNNISKRKIKEKFSGKMPPSTLAKIAMGMVYVGIIAILINFEYAIFFVYLSALLGYATMFNYLIKASRPLK